MTGSSVFRARRLSRSCAVALAAMLAAAPAAADSRTHTIRTGAYAVTSIGSFDTKRTRRYAPTIARAARAFGPPSSRVRRHGGCVVRWKRLGLRIDFHNFGGTPPGQTICGPDASYAQSFAATSRRLRTWKGLRVRMPEDEVLERHRSAEWFDGDRHQPAAWWLRQQQSPFGDGGAYAIVSAHVRRGDVSSLRGWIGAAGE